jgi:hypothetical protein
MEVEFPLGYLINPFKVFFLKFSKFSKLIDLVRAVIHNNKGENLHITTENLVHNTNNSAEVWGLLVGLQAAMELDPFPIISEGDSQIVINILSHLLNGADPEKLSPSWRLTTGIMRINSILQPH